MAARARRLFLCTLAFLSFAHSVSAQPLGTYSWQMTPYCNVLVLAATQLGGQYRLEGYDDQCGAGPRAAVTGLVVPNPDGTLEFGLTEVAATSAAPTHIDITFTIATLGGPWRDSAGHSGLFVFSPVSPSGSPRPNGLGVAAIDASQVQRRVTGACGSGHYIQSLNADGTVSCGTDASSPITGVLPGVGLTGSIAAGIVTLDASFAGPGSAVTVARSDHTHALTASSNTAVGTTALAGLSSGSFDTAAGFQALMNTTTGQFNTAFGAQALKNNQTGTSNTAVGTGALAANLGNSNTGVGFEALFTNVGGILNTAVGYRALKASFNGPNNAALGANALGANSTGSGNVAVGAGALKTQTGGDNNVAIGLNALTTVSGASGNVALGESALHDLIGGSQNTAVGTNSLAGATGGQNAGFGSNTLLNLTTGTANTAMGSGALISLLSGNYNVAVGHNAGSAQTSGDENVYIGFGAGSSNTTGGNNLYLNNTGANGESNVTRIGNGKTKAYFAGVRGVTTGVNNAIAVLIDTNGQLGTMSSSRRYKEDIRDLDGVGLRLQSLRPVQFRYSKPFGDGSKPVQYGLIAEEVNEVLPELVARNADGEIETVQYHVLPTLLVAEVQRLERERVATQRAHEEEMAALRAEMAELRAELRATLVKR